jgi:cytoskeletal protein CcmA (bactofilin family)
VWNREQNTPSPAVQPAVEPEPRHHTPVPERPSSQATTIGESMRIKGSIFSREALNLNGELEGSLELENSLTIGPNGKVRADIKATEIVVSGNVKGNMEAIERIVLRKGAHLVGDVKTAGIVIEDGAFFKGGIDIAQPKAAAAAAGAGSSK